MNYLTNYFLIFVLIARFTNIYAQDFTQSILPIIIIDTDGHVIPDEPKINAKMKIIYNGYGQINHLNENNYHFEGNIGIELRGQSSQHLYDKKGFGIETRDEFGDNLNVSLLDLPEENDWVIHSPFGDKSLIRNALSYHLAGKLMEYAPRIQLSELIINGDYYGVVLFTEKIKRDNNRVNISRLRENENIGDDVTGGYIIKFDKGGEEEVGWVSSYEPFPGAGTQTRFLLHYPDHKAITMDQKLYIWNYVKAFEDILKSSKFDDPEVGYANYIEPQTFIDNIIINELTRNIDGYRLSTYFYKDRDSKGGKLKMGPVWDFNLAYGNADYCEGYSTSGWAWNFNDICPGDYWSIHFWFERLMEDRKFYDDLVKRWTTLRSTIFSDENLIGIVDSFTNLLSEPQIRNFQRWPILDIWVWPNSFVGGSYEAEVNFLKDWLLQRVDWIDENLNQSTNTQDIEHKSELIVYPNPTTGTFFVSGNDQLTKSSKIRLYDLDGTLIWKTTILEPSSPIRIDKLVKSGVYFIQLIQDNQKTYSGKLTYISK